MKKKNVKVLFLNSYTDTTIDEKSGKAPMSANGHITCETPLGLASVYTYAKENLKNFELHTLDANAMLFKNAHKGMSYNWKMLIEKIDDIRPDVVGIGAYFFSAGTLFHETCKRIKELLPTTIIIAGGNYPTDAVEVLLEDKNVDYIVESEGEVTFTEILNAHYNNGDTNLIDGIAFQKNGKKIINKKKTLY